MTNRWAIIGGARYTDSLIQANICNYDLGDGRISALVTALESAAEGVHLYGTASREYKAGSFPTISASYFKQYDPGTQESITACECGVKSSLFNRILTLGAAVSYYESDNKQIEGKELDPEFRLLNACSKTPATAETNRLVNLMRERGVLISRIGTHDNILKTRPPMPFSRQHADLAMKTTEGYP